MCKNEINNEDNVKEAKTSLVLFKERMKNLDRYDIRENEVYTHIKCSRCGNNKIDKLCLKQGFNSTEYNLLCYKCGNIELLKINNDKYVPVKCHFCGSKTSALHSEEHYLKNTPLWYRLNDENMMYKEIFICYYCKQTYKEEYSKIEAEIEKRIHDIYISRRSVELKIRKEELEKMDKEELINEILEIDEKMEHMINDIEDDF